MTYLKSVRVYLLLITLVVGLRLALELASVPERVASEVSLTRLLLVLPVFLGLRYARGEMAGLNMILANFTYVLWGTALVMAATALTTFLDLGTHFQHGPLPAHLAGHAIEGVVMSLLAWAICWVTCRLVSRREG